MSVRLMQGRARLVVTLPVLAAAAAATFWLAQEPAAAPAPATMVPAVEVTVATVEKREVRTWDEFSGRLEAIERVAIRSRVSGEVQAIHFVEGQRVEQGDPLLTIDPEPFAAAVAQAEAQVAAARARWSYSRSEAERARRLWPSRAIAQNLVEQRESELLEADAGLKAAQANLRMARLNLGYTEIRAPVSGRIGRREVTVGNLVDAGPNSPVLTTLVSIDPIRVSFDADEQAVAQALGDPARRDDPSAVPVRMLGNGASQAEGHLQLIDNQVDSRTGTVRVQAVFPNPDGHLTPGQFARLRMGQAESVEALLVDERAIGTDQNRRYVMVVDADNKATYREVSLGARVDGLRIVSSGLAEGERIVVNGLQRIRPGSLVAPQPVGMDGTRLASADFRE
ncbi:efflux RND transporter periplasmic adaptor subunit [Zestomonas carbonaria]|uniref:Efflux pump periplasmic linker BepF n=1 Tax=Zestomonas carbonaria TaxID=2762745 RepID=A0A7U7IBK5_9GAMM|nr:efflux RND transporter periplasmic adaptor subunit [Pseudomonas carbonaria]CAD5110001.1 Efflux pump periplasmic linker BepF [Pseudomonas carbonaria]